MSHIVSHDKVLPAGRTKANCRNAYYTTSAIDVTNQCVVQHLRVLALLWTSLRIYMLVEYAYAGCNVAVRRYMIVHLTTNK